MLRPLNSRATGDLTPNTLGRDLYRRFACLALGSCVARAARTKCFQSSSRSQRTRLLAVEARVLLTYILQYRQELRIKTCLRRAEVCIELGPATNVDYSPKTK